MILYGASGHGKVLQTILKDSLVAFFDDNASITSFLNLSVFQYSMDTLPSENICISIGNNLLRKQIAQRVRHNFENIIADSATINTLKSIGKGSQILHHTLVQVDCTIGDHVIINSSASVDHDCSIGDFVHLAPNSTLCGNVSVGEGTLIGAGATIIPGINIGRWCTIGAGAVVIQNVPNFCTVVGNPARIIKL